MEKKLLDNILSLSQIESDINEHLPLMAILSHLIEPKVIVELGVRAGVSTQAFFSAVCDSSESKLYSYDINEVSPKSHFENAGIRQRLPESFNYDFWEFKIGDSLEVYNDWDENSIDILFIDTKHKPKQLHKELNAWHTKVKPNGLILMHDVVLKKAKLWEGIQAFQAEQPLFKYFECAYNNGLGVLFQPLAFLEHLKNEATD